MLKYAKRTTRTIALALVGFIVGLVAVFSAGYADNSLSSLPTIDTSLAACAAQTPSVGVEPKQVVPNGSFEVQGEGFGKLVECDDVGPAGEEPEGAVFEPRKDISIGLRQGSQKWELANNVDANQDLAFGEELKLPTGVEPGEAIVTAEGNQGLVEAPISVSSVNGETGQGNWTTGDEDVTSLPQTGGIPLVVLAGGLVFAGFGGLLLKRRFQS